MPISEAQRCTTRGSGVQLLIICAPITTHPSPSDFLRVYCRQKIEVVVVCLEKRNGWSTIRPTG